jgi:hypothetical protein
MMMFVWCSWCSSTSTLQSKTFPLGKGTRGAAPTAPSRTKASRPFRGPASLARPDRDRLFSMRWKSARPKSETTKKLSDQHAADRIFDP